MYSYTHLSTYIIYTPYLIDFKPLFISPLQPKYRYRVNVDILTWKIHPVGGDRFEGVEGGNRFFTPAFVVHLFREYQNLV